MRYWLISLKIIKKVPNLSGFVYYKSKKTEKLYMYELCRSNSEDLLFIFILHCFVPFSFFFMKLAHYQNYADNMLSKNIFQKN